MMAALCDKGFSPQSRKGRRAVFSVAGDLSPLKLWQGKEAGNGKPPPWTEVLNLPAGRAVF
jgi:hypothetical protein